jgi:hypothetical protein
MRTREQILEERKQLKSEYGELFDELSRILYRADPIGIAFDNPNTDEYDPEAGTILPQLKACTSDDDVLRIVHEEFVRWFELATAGPRDNYRSVATEIWQLWRMRRTV